MSRLFDAYVMVDWSAAATPKLGKDGVWIGVLKRDIRFRLAFEAFTRWKSATEIGVRFVRSCDFRGRAPSHLLDIKALWMKSRTRSPRRALMSQKAMVVGRKGR